MTANAYELSNLDPLPFSPWAFHRFQELISVQCGIRIPENKQILLQHRIGKRVRALNFGSYEDYYNYLLSADGARDELNNLWSAITTNHTHFFREEHHFEFLRNEIIPSVAARKTKGGNLNIWSAGCSSGQEPYSVAAVMQQAIDCGVLSDISVSILATDIDGDMLRLARGGRYSPDEVAHIPGAMLSKYFFRCEDAITVGEQLRSMVNFRHLNLRQLPHMTQRFDLILCRNVVMYFEAEFRKRLADYYYEQLRPGGILILGTSEALLRANSHFERRRHGRVIAYRKMDVGGAR